jgi:hypothetical protein
MNFSKQGVKMRPFQETGKWHYGNGAITNLCSGLGAGIFFQG